MATDKQDKVTGQLDFSVEDRQWMAIALTNQVRSLERMMAKYPAGSGAYSAHQKDVSLLRVLLERVRAG